MTVRVLFFGIVLIGIGINWFVGGLLLHSVSGDLAKSGILLAFLYGAMGVFYSLLLSRSENKAQTFPTHSDEPHRQCPNCNMAIPFYSVQYCPHCGHKLNQTEARYPISEVKEQ
jgi:hypothetical protein